MKKLKVENLECNICNEHYDKIFCDDDVVLLSGSVENMQKMINMCYDYMVLNSEYVLIQRKQNGCVQMYMVGPSIKNV